MAKNFELMSLLTNAKKGKQVMSGKDKSMNAMQQMKYGAEKMMTKSTMTGQLDKAMGGKEMMKKKKGGYKY